MNPRDIALDTAIAEQLRLAARIAELDSQVSYLAGKWRDAMARYRVAEEDADGWKAFVDWYESLREYGVVCHDCDHRRCACERRHAEALKARAGQ